MGSLRHNEKRARLALRAGRPLALPQRLLLPPLVLLPLVLVIGVTGTPDGIQALRPAAAARRNYHMDHHLRPTVSTGGGDHARRALSTTGTPSDESESEKEKEGVPFSARFVFEGELNWMDELVTTTRSSVPATTAAVGDFGSPSHGRGLQTAGCSAGVDFSLTSTVHAEASGCYSEKANDTNAYFTADDGRIVLPASISASSSTSETFAWVAGKVLGFSGGALDVDPECVSDRAWAANSHPKDAGSWSCLVGGTLVAFSQESFGVECGCSNEESGTPVEVEMNTPAPASGDDPAAVSSPSSAGELSCDASSITITSSSQLDGFDGCYADTGVDGTTSHYSQTSDEPEGGVYAVFAASLDERGHNVRWIAGTYANMSTDSGIVPTCISDDNATEVHPADSTWLCDITGTGAFLPVNETQFQVDCGGCDSTSPSSTSSEETTPSPEDSRNIAPSTSTESSSSTDSGGSAAAAAAAAPTPSPSTQSAGAIESGANGGLPSASSGVFSAFGVAGLAAIAGILLPFIGE